MVFAMGFGIAFEGCAAKAAFHVGVAEWMHERGLRPAAVCGASSGAIIASAIACRESAALRESWLEVGDQPVFQPRRLLRGGWPFAMSDIVGEAVRKALGQRRLSDVKIPLGIAVTVLGRRGFQRQTLTHRDEASLTDAVLASCFLPGPYSKMIPVQGRLALDGAWKVRTPCDDLLQLGVTKTIACVGNESAKLFAGFFRRAALEVPSHCRVLAPVEPLPMASFDLDRRHMLASIEIGRRSADKFFQNHEEWLL